MRESKSEIRRGLNSDYAALMKVRNQDKANPQWADWSEDERNSRLQSITKRCVEERKRSGKHVSCRFEVFAHYVPQFLGSQFRDPQKQELIQEQITVRGQEPIEEGEEGRGYDDDDEDDEEPVPTHLMAKSEKSGERELNDIEPYAASAEADDKSDDEDRDDNGNSKSEDGDEDEAECASDDEDEDKEEQTQPQTAIILGHPHPLPGPPSQLTKPLDALKQFYRTSQPRKHRESRPPRPIEYSARRWGGVGVDLGCEETRD